MTEPLVELDAQDEMVGAVAYDIPVIEAGVVDTDKVFRWAGLGSTDGSLNNITRPASGDAWGDQFWLEDLSTTDIKLLTEAYTPDAVTQPKHTFKLTSNVGTFATAPRITVYDDSGRTEAEEVCVGTTGHTAPLIKGVIATVETAPGQYWGEGTSQLLHDKEVAGANSPNGLCGTTNYLECSSVDLNTTPEFFTLAFSCPDDVTLGTPSVDCVTTIEYTYT